MSTQKTNKSLTKRLKLTKSGKVIRRGVGQNHFNSKQSRKKQLSNKRSQEVKISRKKLFRHVPHR